jgi:hypothetical protein
VIGTVFFDYLDGHSFHAAFTHSAPYAAAAFLVSAALSLVLPRTAVADEYTDPAPSGAEARQSWPISTSAENA